MYRRQLIMERALELFATHGFNATSVQQITDECRISKGAFYLSFKSKDELIFALIDQSLQQITSDIDYAVNRAQDHQLLHSFYYETFQSLREHADFGRLLMREQTKSFNEKVLLKIRDYDTLFDKTILLVVERLYGEKTTDIKYDLAFNMKGLVNVYSSLFLFHHVPVDLDLLSQSLVEKTELLAQYTTIPFMSKELMHIYRRPIDAEITKEQIIEVINQTVSEMDESIVKESLHILKQQILEPTLNNAILIGLLENIRHDPRCKWVAYLIRNFLQV